MVNAAMCSLGEARRAGALYFVTIDRDPLVSWIVEFVRESNRLAGIHREPTVQETSAHRGLAAADRLCAGNLEMFVHHVEPGATLRSHVSFGDTEGVDATRRVLDRLLELLCAGSISGEALTSTYYALRPFTDANGRSGRALLLWDAVHSNRMREIDCDSARPFERRAGARNHRQQQWH